MWRSAKTDLEFVKTTPEVGIMVFQNAQKQGSLANGAGLCSGTSPDLNERAASTTKLPWLARAFTGLCIVQII